MPLHSSVSISRLTALALLVVGLAACNREPAPAPAPELTLRDRADLLLDPIEPVAGLSPDRVALGARLYHDPNLSGDGTVSCATCHSIADGGDDGAPTSSGIGGQLGPINSPTTLNSHLNFVQFWDGRAGSLEEQAAGPVANPLEMGSSIDNAVAYLRSEPSYVESFNELFDGTIDEATVTTAIADFERSLTTPNSPFDRWLIGVDDAMSDEAIAGLELFLDSGCTGCHRGAGLGGLSYEKLGAVHDYFERRGGELTDADHGRFNVTQNETDRHRFKVPLLRNIALTAPYFHDASATTLGDAVQTMAWVQLGRELTDEQTAQLVAFLDALTGEIPAIDVLSLNIPAPRVPVEDSVVPGDAPSPIDNGESVHQ
jgi:cytochrome c peroxidase